MNLTFKLTNQFPPSIIRYTWTLAERRSLPQKLPDTIDYHRWVVWDIFRTHESSFCGTSYFLRVFHFGHEVDELKITNIHNPDSDDWTINWVMTFDNLKLNLYLQVRDWLDEILAYTYTGVYAEKGGYTCIYTEACRTMLAGARQLLRFNVQNVQNKLICIIAA